MTVKELTEMLKKHPPDMEVMVESYEEGFDPATDIKVIPVSKKENKEWYKGVYEENPKSDKKALLIQSRYNRSENEND